MLNTLFSTTSSKLDYYPFGMGMPGRGYADGTGYSYGFNGKESFDEVYGNDNAYDLGLRIYNPRLGRFLSIDPKSEEYSWQTPYAYFCNNPVVIIDLFGAGGPGEQKEICEGEGAEPDQYIIQPKDNFWTIENKLGIEHGKLQQWNPTLDPQNLQINSTINISDPAYADIENTVEFSTLPFENGDFVPRAIIPAQADGMPVNLWQVYSEFKTGTGPVNSVFIENPFITGALVNSNGVQSFTDYLYQKFSYDLAEMQNYANDHNRALVTGYDPYGTFKPTDEWGNGVIQFIGGYSVDAFLSYDNKTIIFVVTDAKSVHSLLYHVTHYFDHERKKEGDKYSNTYQKYIWFAPFDPNYSSTN